jgi:nucleotide-binding universal stress UspA family protein
MNKIIVGVDGSEGSSDAIALASDLAGLTGSTLTLVNVFPYDERPSRASNAPYEGHLRRDSQALLERLRRAHGDEHVDIRSIANPSPAHALHQLAQQEDAGLLVVGSTHTGRAGRVLPGSTAERLLHGAPCPVAVAPKGHAQRSGREAAMIGCGHDGSASAQRALEAAHSVAAAKGARLRIIRVFEPLAYGTPQIAAAMGGTVSSNNALHQRASEELETAIGSIESEPWPEPYLAVGDPAPVLAEGSELLDLLFVGSRAYGPAHAVMVGGVTGRLVREAACPVIVCPRGAGHTGEQSLFATIGSPHVTTEA